MPNIKNETLPLNLEPRTAVVTGASAGLGREFASQLAARGYDLILTARRADRLQALADELAGRWGRTVQVLPADLADAQDLTRLEDTLQQAGPLDLLINNAGFGLLGNFWKLEQDAQTEMIHVHVTASTRLAHAVLPGMLARRHGGLVQVASLAAFIPGRHSVLYNATKAFLVAFSQSLQAELKGSGVQVQALCPGFTRTEFHDTPQLLAQFHRGNYPGWLWLKASDVVADSLRAVERGSGVLVPGLGYRLVAHVLHTALLGGLIRKVITG